MNFQEAILNWGENPLSVSQIKSSNEVMGWGEKAIEIRSIDRGLLNGVFMHKRPNKLKFLTEKNDKVFFASVQSPTNSQGRGLQYFIRVHFVPNVKSVFASKGSSDSSNFIFDIIVGKRRRRDLTTTLK